MLDSIVTAVSWTKDLLAGPFATSVGAVAIAAIGAAMLSGRLDQKRALTALVGCFLIFGASAISNALLSGIGDTRSSVDDNAPLPAPQAAQEFDPYAGASPLPRPVSKEEARGVP